MLVLWFCTPSIAVYNHLQVFMLQRESQIKCMLNSQYGAVMSTPMAQHVAAGAAGIRLETLWIAFRAAIELLHCCKN